MKRTPIIDERHQLSDSEIPLDIKENNFLKESTKNMVIKQQNRNDEDLKRTQRKMANFLQKKTKFNN
jgi:hypothetical protein